MRSAHVSLGAAALALLAAAWACRTTDARPPARWFKGNTHTHTLWSDGDGAPELVVDWYRSRGYDFLALSDHNLLLRGERWFPIAEGTRLDDARVAQLEARFGPLELRERNGGREMRLRVLEELRQRFELPGEFVLIEAEEITDRAGKAEVHVNALNVSEPIAPQGGDTARAALERNLAAVESHAARSQRPVLAHVNHPNFRWSLTWEDLAPVALGRFLEIYNGHPAVNNEGDATRPGAEVLWDLVLTSRLRERGLPPVFGLATDDAHGYHAWGVGQVNPGRGWVMVRARESTPDALVSAMLRGEFYSSSGVTLTDVEHDARRYRVTIQAEPGVRYTTRFIGARGEDAPSVLLETDANPAEYRLRGDEWYVRATISSSKPHPNPYKAGDLEQAWTQPYARTARPGATSPAAGGR